jgi:BMFP domain-containing protein YqiC
MRDHQNLIDDLLTFGSNLFGNALGARHELKAQAMQRGEQIGRMLNLVSREEFDAAFAMLAKARALQDNLDERLQAVEKHLNLRTTNSANKAASKKARASAATNLPSVKKDKRRGK